MFVLAAASFMVAENTADAQLLKNLVNKVKGKSAETTAANSAATAVSNMTSVADSVSSILSLFK